MTQKLNVLELSVFQEEINFYPMWPLLQTGIWILFALDYTEEERKNVLFWWEANAEIVFLGENQCEVSLPVLEKGEEVGEGMRLSIHIIKVPFFALVDILFLVLQLRELSSLQGL